MLAKHVDLDIANERGICAIRDEGLLGMFVMNAFRYIALRCLRLGRATSECSTDLIRVSLVWESIRSFVFGKRSFP